MTLNGNSARAADCGYGRPAAGEGVASIAAAAGRRRRKGKFPAAPPGPPKALTPLAAPPLPPLPPKPKFPSALPPAPPGPPKALTPVTDSPSVPLPAKQPSVKQSAPGSPGAPNTSCARGLAMLAIIKARGSTAANKSRVKNEQSSPNALHSDIEPPTCKSAEARALNLVDDRTSANRSPATLGRACHGLRAEFMALPEHRLSDVFWRFSLGPSPTIS